MWKEKKEISKWLTGTIRIEKTEAHFCLSLSKFYMILRIISGHFAFFMTERRGSFEFHALPKGLNFFKLIFCVDGGFFEPRDSPTRSSKYEIGKIFSY